MSKINTNQNNFFFANNCKNNFFKEKIILETNSPRNSISTNETYENDFCSEDEDMDFNQDFFPQNKKIKITDSLIDNWKEKINILSFIVKTNLSNIEKNV